MPLVISFESQKNFDLCQLDGSVDQLIDFYFLGKVKTMKRRKNSCFNRCVFRERHEKLFEETKQMIYIDD